MEDIKQHLNKIILGDCLEEMKKLPENSVDSICCDPPYELGFMGKSWDNTGIANNKEMWAECLRVLKPGGHLLAFSGTRTYHRMASAIEDAGFEVRDMIEWVMGSGFPKSLNIFKQLEKRCDCGIMSEYGERTTKNTKHYLRPLREADIQASKYITEEQRQALLKGLPKQSLPIEKEVSYGLFLSERAGESSVEGRCYLFQKEGELYRCAVCQMSAGVFSDGEKGWLYNGAPTCNGDTHGETTHEGGGSAPREPQSRGQQDREPCAFCKQFGAQAIRAYGWGSAMKPAHEPICVARKPLSESNIADNFLKYGTGGINIDESRVGTETISIHNAPKGTFAGGEPDRGSDTESYRDSVGRFPANLCWSCDCDNNYLTGNALFDILSNISNQIKLCQLNNSNSNALNVEQKKHQQDTTSEEKKLCFAVENVDTLFLEKILGKTLEVIFSVDTECSVEMLEESMNTSLSISLSGNEKMEEYQKVLKFITLTATNLITELKTCNLSQSQIIGSFITKVISGIREQSRVKSHSEDCWVRECFPETKGGGSQNGSRKWMGENGNGGFGGWAGKVSTDHYVSRDDGTGNASRFFKSISTIIDPIQEWVENEVAEHKEEILEDLKKEYGFIKGKSIIYQAKASKSERNKGCEGLEKKQYSHDGRDKEIENPYQRNKSVATNNHPTVKPIALMEYLIKMVTPKGGIVLDPFAGSGSTLVAAKQNGFQYIGIEMTEEYIPIIEARLKGIIKENTLF